MANETNEIRRPHLDSLKEQILSLLHPDRLFPADLTTRSIARDLHAQVADLPIISPHGHTDPKWWGDNQNFQDAAELLVIPDHYIVRMLVSQGISYGALGIGENAQTDRRLIWRLFAEHYPLFRGTPSRL